MTALRLAGGQVLVPGEGLVEAAVALDGGLIAGIGSADAGPGPEIDLSGHLVLPGIVDLHGDGFERQLQPRRGAFFDFRLGLAAADAELAANGVTTAWMAQSWSWEGAARAPDYARGLVAALAEMRPALRTDIHVQIRFETHMVDDAEALAGLLGQGLADYVVFNDHLPLADARLAADGPGGLTVWASHSGRTAEEFLAVIRAAQARAPEVQDAVAAIAARLRSMGIPLGSHDDATPADRARFRALGARICEFPMTREAAAAARAAGDPVLMGAPNVVRGRSASGNVRAEELVAEGLCDVLVSDYYAPALAAAAWALADRGVLAFADAWALVSTNAADAIGRADRGRIAPGRRADLAIVDAATRRVEGTIAGGRVAHLSGALAARWLAAAAPGPAARAAE